MALKGDLLSADLSNVFQMVSMNRQRGKLVVRDRGNVLNIRHLYIDESRVALLDSLPERPVEGFLVQTELIDFVQHKEAVVQAKKYKHTPLHVMMGQGWITQTQIEQTRTLLLEEEILEIFLWRNVSFTLDETTSPPEDALYFSVDHVVMEAARRQDEWRHVMDDSAAQLGIYGRTTTQDLEGITDINDTQKLVLDYLDGMRGTSDIIEASGLSRFFVDLSLRALEEKGYVALKALPELLAAGDGLLTEGNIAGGVRLYLAALRFDRRNITIHKRLAGAYLQDGRLAKGAAHYRFCAQSLLGSGHRRETITILQHVLKLLPTDFRTLERCVTLLAQEGAIQGPEDQETVRQAGKLMSFFMDAGKSNEALAVAEQLYRLDRENEAHLETLARLRLRVGRKEEAIEAYLTVAQARTARGDLSEALEIYRTMVALDTSGRQVYRTKIADIQRTMERRRKRKRSARMTIILGFLAVVCGACYWIYHGKAQSALNELPAEEPATAENALTRARLYGRVADEFPLTLAAMTARDRERDWEIRAKELGEQDRARRSDVANKRLRYAALAQKKVEEAFGWMKKAKLENSLAAYDEALELGKSAGGAWEGRAEAEKGFDDITQYLMKGRDLLLRAEQLREEGEPQKAFELMVEAAKSHYLVPEVQGMKIPVMFRSFPAGARVTGSALGVNGVAPFEVPLPYEGTAKLTITAPGFAPRQVTIKLPPERYEHQFVLEKLHTFGVQTGEPLMGVAAIKSGVVAGVARNGNIVAVNVRTRKVLFHYRSQRILTSRLAPLSFRTGLLTLSQDGVAAFVSLKGEHVWTVEAFGIQDAVLPPRSHGETFILLEKGGGMVCLRAHDGQEVWRRNAGGRISRGLVAGGYVVLALENGGLIVHDVKTGKPAGVLGGAFRPLPGRGVEGWVLAPLTGRGLAAIVLPGGGNEMLSEFEGEMETAPLMVGKRIVFGMVGEGLVILDADGSRTTIPVAGGVSRIVGGEIDHAILQARSGQFLVLDLKAKQLLFALPGGRDAGSDPIISGGKIYRGHEDGRLLVTSIR